MAPRVCKVLACMEQLGGVRQLPGCGPLVSSSVKMGQKCKQTLSALTDDTLGIFLPHCSVLGTL